MQSVRPITTTGGIHYPSQNEDVSEDHRRIGGRTTSEEGDGVSAHFWTATITRN